MRLATALSCSALLAAALALGVNGIGRSLWLDEAWVANSIRTPALPEMFYYREWVQSSPPLFLLASRGAVRLLGLSNTAFRVVPLLMALVAAAGMFLTARRILSFPFALLASALLVFYTAEVEYSHTAKQYSGEVAATTILLLAATSYLKNPGPRRFYWLIAATAVAMPLSYPTVFLLPGVVLAVYLQDRRSAVTLALAAAVILAILYVAFIRPNLSNELRIYWSWDPENGFSPGALIALVALVALAWAGRLPTWMRLICMWPCLLLAVSGTLKWYPLSYRTRLFVLPCFLLAVAMSAENLCERWIKPRGLLHAIPLTLLAATVVLGVRAQIRADPRMPKEDVDGAVRFLQSNVAANDLLLIHPSVKESFLLYTAMDGWTDPPARYGDTGWPCCPRGTPLRPEIYSAPALLRDVDRMAPTGFSGRVWMLYTIRHEHWEWVGFDESKLWRGHLADRGCLVSAPNRMFENLAISLASCVRLH